MELVGISEIATLASVSRAAVNNWVARNPSFPKAIADLACGQIWEKSDVTVWLSQNKILRENNMDAINNLQIGNIYTHDFICKLFGGDAKSGTYLPQSKQTILCGCFTSEKNPDAPVKILVGHGPRIIAKAERLETQGGSIPVFLKQGTNQWAYQGIFELVRLSRDPVDFENEAVIADRCDVIAALIFRKVEA
jgi:predicted DNA-binding transcriptional regulator AlpA